MYSLYGTESCEPKYFIRWSQIDHGNYAEALGALYSLIPWTCSTFENLFDQTSWTVLDICIQDNDRVSQYDGLEEQT